MSATSIFELSATEIEQVSGGTGINYVQNVAAQAAAESTKDSKRTFTAQSDMSRKWSQTLDGIAQNLK